MLCPTVHSAPCTTRYRCLPTGVTGSRSRPTPPGFGQIVLCRPDACVRVSFAPPRVSIVGWIYDPDHSLPPGMYVDVPHLDCLLVAAPITVERLDHIILKPKQLDGVVAVNVDEVLGHVIDPKITEAEPRIDATVLPLLVKDNVCHTGGAARLSQRFFPGAILDGVLAVTRLPLSDMMIEFA